MIDAIRQVPREAIAILVGDCSHHWGIRIKLMCTCAMIDLENGPS